MGKIEWEEIARRGRNHAVLSMDLVARGMAEGGFGELYGEEMGISRWRQFDSARWMDAAEIATFGERMRKSLEKDPEYMLKIGRKAVDSITEMRKVVDRINGMDLREMENSKILALFEELAKCYRGIGAPTYSYILVNKFYSDSVAQIVEKREKDPHKQAGMIKKLLAIEREYALKLERESIAKLARKHAEKTLKEEEIAEHARKFGHMGRYVFYGKPYDAKKLMERIEQLVEKGVENESRRLEEQNSHVKEQKIMEKELAFTEGEMIRLKTIREWIWFSYYNDEIWGYTAHFAMNLWEEIGKRLGLTYEEVIELIYPEIVEGLKQGKKCNEEFRKRIAERYQNSALLMENGKVVLMEGEELRKYYGKEKQVEEVFSHITEVRGTSASPGIAKGTVKVLNSINELEKVKKGDVMVAPSTVPAFVPAMEKAAAIVTNEGGLLSHAAIVSREFGIPCIVGTKIATKVFHDGDLVEVDAIKGIVRKVGK
ncbi:MAG: PEP-utilizing enzyme [Candidatus Micrarchaeota archaeon]